MAYDVHLEVFEGPLDLLLYLIRKNDMDIYDIPISQITAEYLEYLNLMKEFNLNIAGEFLVMAATLMQIKSRMLLPTPGHEDEEIEELKADLTAKLLEYEKYKQVGSFLSKCEVNEAGIFYKASPVFSEGDFILDASLFDLIEAFRDALKELPKEVKEIVYEEIPIEQKIRELIDLLEGRRYINFKELLKREKNRIGIIVLFLALLELIRLKQVVARQSQLFGEIRVYRVES
jgi:segregation and condensation protein A